MWTNWASLSYDIYRGISIYVIINYDLIYFFKLGVSNVAELRQALGTGAEQTPQKVSKREAPKHDSSQEKTTKEDTSDELVYKDSSTFLKVHYLFHSKLVNKPRFLPTWI